MKYALYGAIFLAVVAAPDCTKVIVAPAYWTPTVKLSRSTARKTMPVTSNGLGRIENSLFDVIENVFIYMCCISCLWFARNH